MTITAIPAAPPGGPQSHGAAAPPAGSGFPMTSNPLRSGGKLGSGAPATGDDGSSGPSRLPQAPSSIPRDIGVSSGGPARGSAPAADTGRGQPSAVIAAAGAAGAAGPAPAGPADGRPTATQAVDPNASSGGAAAAAAAARQGAGGLAPTRSTTGLPTSANAQPGMGFCELAAPRPRAACV